MARITKPPEERRQELIDTAARLFTEKGYEQTAVRDIVGSLGVAQGLFYYYFKNKEEVFYAVVKQYAGELIAEIAAIIGETATSPLERVHRALDSIDGFLLMEGASWWLRPDAMSERIQIRFYQMVFDTLEPYLADLLSQGVRMGAFQIENELHTARFILSGFTSVYLKAGSGDAAALSDMVRAMIERILGLEDGSLRKHSEGRVFSGGYSI